MQVNMHGVHNLVEAYLNLNDRNSGHFSVLLTFSTAVIDPMRKTPVLNSMYHISSGAKIPYRNREKNTLKLL